VIPRDLAASGADTPSGQSPPLVVELQQALWSWKGHCDEAAAALAGHDLDVADRALAAREAMRPRIQELVGRLRASGAAPGQALGAIARLQQSAAAAEERLISVLEGEQFRLRRDIDGLGRPSAPATAYGRADAPSPHRLDIVR
jgi:hypothetical protein